MSGFLELQKSIIDLLRADAPLAAKVTLIADFAPDSQPPPYVTVGFLTTLPYRTHSRKGEEIFFDIHVWSAHEGNKEAGIILNDIDRLLGDNTSLCISGQDLIAIYYDSVQTFKETLNDVFYRHIVYGVRVLLTNKLERT